MPRDVLNDRGEGKSLVSLRTAEQAEIITLSSALWGG